MTGQRVTLILDEGVDDLLVDLAGSPRKRGAYVSSLIRAAWDARQAHETPIDIETLALTLKVVERRLDHVEDQVAAMIARSSEDLGITRDLSPRTPQRRRDVDRPPDLDVDVMQSTPQRRRDVQRYPTPDVDDD